MQSVTSRCRARQPPPARDPIGLGRRPCHPAGRRGSRSVGPSSLSADDVPLKRNGNATPGSVAARGMRGGRTLFPASFSEVLERFPTRPESRNRAEAVESVPGGHPHTIRAVVAGQRAASTDRRRDAKAAGSSAKPMWSPGKQGRLDAQGRGQRPRGPVAQLTGAVLADADHDPRRRPPAAESRSGRQKVVWLSMWSTAKRSSAACDSSIDPPAMASNTNSGS